MKTYRTEKNLPDRPLFTNNDRKYHGLPLHRKTWKSGKRYRSRCEQLEAVNAFIDYTNR